MRERALAHRLGIRLGPLRLEHRLDEPAHAAGGERLQPARRLRPARGQRRQHRAGARRPERRRLGLALSGRLRAAQLVRGRRGRGRPRDLGEQPRAALAPQLVREQRADVGDERRGLHGVAVLVGGPEGQEQDLLRPRDAGVEEVALLAQDVLVAAQEEPARPRERRAGVVVEERLGRGAARELALLQAADEDGAEAARPDRARGGDEHAAGRRVLADGHRGERLEHLLRAAGQQLGVGLRQGAQLARRPAQLGRRARVRGLLRPEHGGAAAVRRGPDPLPLGEQRVQQRRRPLGGRRGERVELVQRSALPQAPRVGRRHGLRAPRPRVQRVRRVGVGQLAGGAQPRDHVVRPAARQRRAGERQQPGPEPGAGQRQPRVRGDGDPVVGEPGREHLDRGAALAHEHRDVLGRHALAHQLEHLGGHELGLGALAARLQQAHRAVGRARIAPALEQPALQVVQRAPGGRRVVLRAVVEHDVAVGERLQQLDRRGVAGERRPPRLVRQRHPDLGLRAAGQRLDRVELQRVQVVEAVQQHRTPAPGGGPLAQPVQRGAGVALLVAAAEPLQPPVVGRVERRQLLRVGGRLAAGRPAAQRAREPGRRDERAAELGEQVAGRRREAWCAR